MSKQHKVWVPVEALRSAGGADITRADLLPSEGIDLHVELEAQRSDFVREALDRAVSWNGAAKLLRISEKTLARYAKAAGIDPPRTQSLPEEVVREAITLRRELGWTYEEIGDHCGVGRVSVKRWCDMAAAGRAV